MTTMLAAPALSTSALSASALSTSAPSSAALATLGLGVVMGLGLIAAIGAQNAYVLQRSLRGDVRMGPLVLFCVASEALLISGGVLGIGTLVAASPWVMTALRYGGAVFLLAYGVLAAVRAWRGGTALTADGEVRTPTLVGALLTCGAFTWLNPHAYLDTVVFLGSLANQQGPDLRWWFAAGALAAGALWFSALGFGGRALRGVFARPVAWRVLDAGVAVMMVAIAAGLLTS